MVPTGNKVKFLQSVNHSIKTVDQMLELTTLTVGATLFTPGQLLEFTTAAIWATLWSITIQLSELTLLTCNYLTLF